MCVSLECRVFRFEGLGSGLYQLVCFGILTSIPLDLVLYSTGSIFVFYWAYMSIHMGLFQSIDGSVFMF